jgi:hypothetical protein
MRQDQTSPCVRRSRHSAFILKWAKNRELSLNPTPGRRKNHSRQRGQDHFPPRCTRSFSFSQ